MIEVNSQIADLINEHSPIVGKVSSAEVAARDYYAIEVDGEVVACIKTRKVTWFQVEISHLVVKPGYRRRGYARAAVSRACEKAKELGLKLVQCTIRSDNEASMQLFSGEGFRELESFVGLSGRAVTLWQKTL